MIVVTGANGHLGQRLLRELSGRRLLRAVVRSETAARRIAELALRPEPEIRVVDYLDSAAMTAALHGATHVVHLVGIIRQSTHSTYVEAHEQCTQVLAAAAHDAGIKRVIYVSILGARPDSSNPCLASKGKAEQILLKGATPALVVRVPMVLGEGDHASRALARMARRRWSILFRASSREQPIYAGDVIHGLIAGISAGGLDDVSVDLAGPLSVSRAGLVRLAATKLGRRTRVLSLPLAAGLALAFVLERAMASPPVTVAMLQVLDQDDRIDPEPACRTLGIELTDLDTVLAKCLPGVEQ